jgi:hypothetical protein
MQGTVEFAPRNSIAYVCQHVFEATRPVLLIVHEDWNCSFCVEAPTTGQTTAIW